MERHGRGATTSTYCGNGRRADPPRVLERTARQVAGVTCGAGMPYKLSRSPPRTRFSTSDLQSGRAFPRIVERAYSKVPQMALRGGVMKIRCWRRAQRSEQCRRPSAPAGSLSTRGRTARVDARRLHPRHRADRHGGACGGSTIGQLDRQSRARSIMFQFGTRPC